VVLHHVAHHTGFFIKAGALADADVFGHRDLHVVDVVAVPDRLEAGVGETHHQQVLHRLLAEEVVDAVGLVLVEHLQNPAVERARRLRVGAERLLDHQPAPAALAHRQAGLFETAHDPAEKRGRRGQVEQHVVRDAVSLLQRREPVMQPGIVGAGRCAEVSLHEMQVRRETLPVARIEATVFGHGPPHHVAERVVVQVLD
jgi:hypothetical protein